MTFEHRIVVSLSEIKAIIFECNECQSRSAIVPEKLDSIPKRCPNGHAWAPDTGAEHSGWMFSALTKSIRTLRDPLYENVGFKIFLEFEEPKR